MKLFSIELVDDEPTSVHLIVRPRRGLRPALGIVAKWAPEGRGLTLSERLGGWVALRIGALYVRTLKRRDGWRLAR